MTEHGCVLITRDLQNPAAMWTWPVSCARLLGSGRHRPEPCGSAAMTEATDDLSQLTGSCAENLCYKDTSHVLGIYRVLATAVRSFITFSLILTSIWYGGYGAPFFQMRKLTQPRSSSARIKPQVLLAPSHQPPQPTGQQLEARKPRYYK